MIKQRSKFPKTYKDVSTELLLDAFQQGPKRVAAVITGLSREDLLARPRPGKWSTQEILLHVVDSEIMGSARIRQTFAQSGSLFAGYDQDIWANFFSYQSQDRNQLQTALKLFEALRGLTSTLFRNARGKDWQKTGIHPEHGVVTLRNLLELYADHSERHIEQILEIRRLIDKPLKFPLLLDKRLY